MIGARFAGKCCRFLYWRAREAHEFVHRRLARYCGLATRQLRWPFGIGVPYRRKELHLVRGSGLGDVLLCTPVLRELRRLNPQCGIHFYTDYPALFDGSSLVDRVHALPDPALDSIWLSYEHATPPRRHLARIMGDSLGIAVNDVRPSCSLDEAASQAFRTAWSNLPRPWILVNRHASDWTPNKEWPHEYWDLLIDRLLSWCTVVEVGRGPDAASSDGRPNYVNLVGALDLRGLIAAIAAADLHVGPISGPVHIAAAFGVPSVVIYGGYETPGGTKYPGNVNLYTKLPCSPCWLREPCPYDRKCLRMIEPESVIASLQTLWTQRQFATT